MKKYIGKQSRDSYTQNKCKYMINNKKNMRFLNNKMINNVDLEFILDNDSLILDGGDELILLLFCIVKDGDFKRYASRIEKASIYEIVDFLILNDINVDNFSIFSKQLEELITDMKMKMIMNGLYNYYNRVNLYLDGISLDDVINRLEGIGINSNNFDDKIAIIRGIPREYILKIKRRMGELDSEKWYVRGN